MPTKKLISISYQLVKSWLIGNLVLLITVGLKDMIISLESYFAWPMLLWRHIWPINMCFRTATFADNLKNAELSPIHKKGDNLNKTNYQPVSVFMVVSKLHEGVMNDQRREYFVNILNDFVCAYRKNYSCQSVFVKMVDDWKVLVDNNHIIGVIFMDLPKAFNCLPHGLLTANFELTVQVKLLVIW